MLDVIRREAEAINKGPEYSISETTHWHECWRYSSHHACAVAEVERLRAALDECKMRAQSNQLETIQLLNGISDKMGSRLNDLMKERLAA